MSKEWRSTRPQPGEADPYFFKYIDRVPDADIVDTLSAQIAETLVFLRALPESKGGHRYAPEKWTIREVIGHLADTERVFAYRALRFSRADETPVAGFDENSYVANGSFNDRTLDDIITEFEHVRRASIGMFHGLSEEMMSRRGVANGKEVSVRALAFIAAGHVTHHVDLLKTRYLA
jgi:hypothetical protein